MAEPQSIIIYQSTLLKIGGIETFIVNFCKRLKRHYRITFVFDKADHAALKKIQEHARCVRLANAAMKADYLILASAWGKSHSGLLKAPVQVQTIHADYEAFAREFNFKYTKAPGTTHHVAVSHHVATAFEKVTGIKVDAVIYNLL